MPNVASSATTTLLNLIGDQLDITETQFETAESRYKAIGAWLGESDSEILLFSPRIYVQGSIGLGTTIKPIGGTEFDVDLVCQLEIDSSTITPSLLKKIVGDRLKQNANYRKMLEEKNRCWRLNYSGEFHMDILPAIPKRSGVDGAILIPDKQLSDWSSSNPRGYANWFANRMKTQLLKVAEARGVHIDDLPIHSARTPLQRVVQLLKRHRDIKFENGNSADDKPTSMIITTLAALIYKGEPDVESALANAVQTLYALAPLLVRGKQIDEHISNLRIIERDTDGHWQVLNPVNPEENFADKWHENNNRKAQCFFDWVKSLYVDLGQSHEYANQDSQLRGLKSAFGQQLVQRAADAVPDRPTASDNSVVAPLVKISKPSKAWSTHVGY